VILPIVIHLFTLACLLALRAEQARQAERMVGAKARLAEKEDGEGVVRHGTGLEARAAGRKTGRCGRAFGRLRRKRE
jgi:hypothetical protein